jgi:hypothetical protein
MMNAVVPSRPQGNHHAVRRTSMWPQYVATVFGMTDPEVALGGWC